MKKPVVELLASIPCAAILVALIVGIYYYLPSNTFAFALGIVAAIDSGFLLSLVIFALQSPDLQVTVANDEWNPNSPFFFLHVVVKNNSTGFLGGGIAAECRGEISVDGAGKFTPKWATRAEPIHRDFAPVGPSGGTFITTVEPALIDQAKYETIGPEEERTLDIAVKVDGDAQCYIHEPENYYEPMHKRNGYGPGKHQVALILKYGSRKTGPFEFVIDNGSGTKPNTVSLRAKQ